MRLYKNSNGVWAGTQADARKMCGKGYSTVDVPTDKPNLLSSLTSIRLAPILVTISKVLKESLTT